MIMKLTILILSIAGTNVYAEPNLIMCRRSDYSISSEFKTQHVSDKTSRDSRREWKFQHLNRLNKFN